MHSISYTHSDGDDYVTEEVTTEAQTATVYGHLPNRVIRVSTADGQLVNDGNDSETVTVEVVDGLEIARGTDPSTATVLDLDSTATLTVDGYEVSVSITSGSGTKNLTTTKPAGTTIDIKAVGLDAGPIDRGSVKIEVVSA